MMHAFSGPIKTSCLIFFFQITSEGGVAFNVPVKIQNNKRTTYGLTYRSTEE